MAEAKTFTYRIRARPTGSLTFRVLQAQFGDGYTQKGSDGIHSIKRSYQVSIIGGPGCDLSYNEALEAKKFLEETYGYISFFWMPPGETVAFRFTCPGLQIVHDGGGIYTVTTTFEQVHFP